MDGAIPKIEVGEIVLVKWLDAFNAQGTWVAEADLNSDDEYPVSSIGYHVGIGKNCLMICRDKGPGNMGGLFYIPIGMIQSVERITSSGEGQKQEV